MKTKQKIAFFGSDEISLPCLHALQESSQGWEVGGVLTQPDRKSGRGRKLQPNPIKKWALENNIPVRDPQKPGDVEVDWLKELGTDIVLVMAYGHILNNSLLNAAPCFNLHASLLPRYRGASPIETALAMGEKETGVSLMRVVPRMDAGPLIDCQSVSIIPTDTGPSLRQKIALASVPLIQRSMPGLLSQNFLEVVQDESQASYCRKLNKSDGQLDFSLSAKEIEFYCRAFSGWPGAWFWHDTTIIKVGKLSVYDGSLDLSAGQRCPENKNSLIIGTGSGSIEVLELQKPGGKMLPISEFLRGYSLPTQITFSLPETRKPLVCKK